MYLARPAALTAAVAFCMPTMRLLGFHLRRLRNGARGVRMQLE
jgi:hypothetical protein